MTNLTDRQVAGIVNSGGGPPSGSTTAQWVALARRENSTFTVEKEDFLGSGHFGLWQISAKDHFAKYGSQYGDVTNFTNVLKNSALVQWNVAARLYRDQGWAPWRFSGIIPPMVTAQDRDAVTNADNSIGKSGGGDLGGAIPEQIPGLGNPLTAISDAIQTVLGTITSLAEWVGDPHNWVRIVQVVGGVALGLVATNIVLGNPVGKVPL